MDGSVSPARRNHGTKYVLSGTLPQYIDQDTVNPLCRFRPLMEWLDARYEAGVDPYSKYTSSPIAPIITTHGRKGDRYEGINFASQDYLNLATHFRAKGAAFRTIELCGVHSAGSPALMGDTIQSIELEKKIADFTGYKDCTLFPTGWAAGYGIVRALVRPQDHVLIDILSHACLHEGARAATPNVHVFPHLSNEAVERRLARIRERAPTESIIVVTESTFSMDSDVPAIPELKAICSAMELY